MNIEDILSKIPDKRVDKNTTSLKLKRDILEYFEDLKLKNCVEIGTSKGYTTNILSYLFENVTTFDIDKSLLITAKEFNSDRDNIDYYLGDATNSEWDFDKFDVAFIDANHSYAYVNKM